MAVLVAVRDIAFRSKIEAVGTQIGVALRVAPRTRPLSEAAREPGVDSVLADLSMPGVLDEVRLLRAAGGPRVVGFLGHLQADLGAAARDAGVGEVLSRGELVRRMEEVLRGAARASPYAGPEPVHGR